MPNIDPSVIPTNTANGLLLLDSGGLVPSSTLPTGMLTTAGGASNRQMIMQGSVNSLTGAANFLSAGTGLAVNLSATATPLIMSFAAGFSTTTGAINYIGSATADLTPAWSSLTANTTNYLYIDRNSSTGVLTYGATISPPYYQAFIPTAVSLTAPSGGNTANLMDGNTGTQLVTNTSVGSAYVIFQVDFGANETITSLTVSNVTTGHTGPVYQLQTSPDNSTWTTLGSTFSGSSTQTGSVSARYVRFYISSYTGNSTTGVGEFSYVKTTNNGTIPVIWFDTNTQTMKSGSGGGGFTAIQRMFVGTAVTNGTNVTSVTHNTIGGTRA